MGNGGYWRQAPGEGAEGMSYKVMILDQKARAAEKQASRDEDERRLKAGEITEQELRRENSFFGALFEGDNHHKWRMVAIGKTKLLGKDGKGWKF